MVWYFIGVYIINRTLHGCLETRHFSSRVENLKGNFVSPRGHKIFSLQLALLTFSFEYFNSTLNILIRFNEWSNYCITKGSDEWKVYVDGTFKASLPDPGDLPFFDSDEDDEDDDDNDDDHLILKDELLDHLTQVNPIVFTLNQWYHCKKIHPSKFSNTRFSHSTTLKEKLHLPNRND